MIQSDAFRRSLKDDILDQLVRRNSLVKSPRNSLSTPPSGPGTPTERKMSVNVEQRRASAVQSPASGRSTPAKLDVIETTSPAPGSPRRGSAQVCVSPLMLPSAEIPADRRESVDLAFRLAGISSPSTDNARRGSTNSPLSSPRLSASPIDSRLNVPEQPVWRSSIQSPVRHQFTPPIQPSPPPESPPPPDRMALTDEIARLKIENDSLVLRLRDSQAQYTSFREVRIICSPDMY